jgi:hypothetical protein
MIRTTPNKIIKLHDNEIFVFGSNKDGRHGKGAAKLALSFGAKMGIGNGLSGKTYAIPTRHYVKGKYNTIGVPFFDGECSLVTLNIVEISEYIDTFIMFANLNRNLSFLVTEIGCNNAGYKPKDIAPLFNMAKNLDNIFLPISFWNVI